MLSLVRRLEKDTVESFREPKAQSFLRPALDKLSAASYCVFLSAHSPLSFSPKAISEHVEAFFDNAEIKEEYRLAKSRYLQILLEDYETSLRNFSAMVVSGFDASAFEEIYGAHAEQGAQIILAFLGVYSLWAENHAKSWRKTPILRRSTAMSWRNFAKLPATSITTSANVISPKIPRRTTRLFATRRPLPRKSSYPLTKTPETP